METTPRFKAPFENRASLTSWLPVKIRDPGNYFRCSQNFKCQFWLIVDEILKYFFIGNCSWTFSVFSKVTASLLILSSVIVTARQFFGQPITCDPGAKVRLLQF